VLARIAILAGALALGISGVAFSATSSTSSRGQTNRDAVYATSPLVWSNPIELHHSGNGQLRSLACPSTTQCTAIDSAGSVVTFNPASPGFPSATTIEPRLAAQYADARLVAVACPSTDECVAVDSEGDEITFDPTSPGTPAVVAIDHTDYYGPEPIGLACPSAEQCTTVNAYGQESTFDPKAPEPVTPVSIDKSDRGEFLATSFACPSSTQCTIVGSEDYEYSSEAGEVTFDPKAPVEQIAASLGGSGTYLDSVACPSNLQCTAVDNGDHEVTFSPSSPSSHVEHQVGTSDVSLGRVACASITRCVAVAVGGDEVTFDPATPGSATSASVDEGRELDAIACPTESQCTAVDEPVYEYGVNGGYGHEVTFEPRSPGSPTPAVIDDTSYLAAVECPSATQCTAVDNTGHETTFDPGAPGAPRTALVDNGRKLNGIACPSQSRCIAVDGSGDEVTFEPVTPGTPVPAPIDSGQELNAVACPSTERCTAVDAKGGELTFDPSSPGTPTRVSLSSQALTAIACPALEQCTAVDDEGGEVTFNPRSPNSSSQGALLTTYGPTGVGIACPSSTQCTVAASQGYLAQNEVTFNPQSPGSATPARVEGGPGVACGSPTFCAAVGSQGASASAEPSGGTTAWSWPDAYSDPYGLTAASCPSTTVCVGVDAAGDVIIGEVGATVPVPINLRRPEVYGNTFEGRRLYGSQGQWLDNPTAYTYQWEKCNASGAGCSLVSEATESSYVPGAADLGHALRLKVTAVNAGGSSTPVESPPTSAVTVGSPLNVSPPVISGNPLVDEVLHCSKGTWDNAPTSYEYEWLRDGNWIDNQNDPTYTVQAKDVGHNIACRVTAGNGEGYERALSQEVAIASTTTTTTTSSRPPATTAASTSSVAISTSTTATTSAPATNPPTETGAPKVNPKTGEVQAEYEFPEAGEAEAYGEVAQGASLARIHSAGYLAPQLTLFVSSLTPDEAGFLSGLTVKEATAKKGKCAKGYVKKATKCVSNAPVTFGLVKLAIPAAGTYKIEIKPSGKVLAALKKGKTLDVRVTLVFTPAGTTTKITKVSSVRLHLKPEKKR
jgi:hypothetical protein